MPHFYVLPENITGDKFRITGEDVHYLSAVRRYAPGDKLKLFDGKGRTLLGVIDSVSKDEIKGTLLKIEKSSPGTTAVNLFQAVPKGDRFDWLAEKAAELGVVSVTPLITERSVTREVSEAKIERWLRLSKAACQQCGRAELMRIEKPLVFGGITPSTKPDGMTIIPWESENSKTIGEVFEGRGKAAKVNIFIGPEGGFSVGEIERAAANGFIPVTLGARILRSETAGLLSSALVMYLLGEYGRQGAAK